MSIQMYQMFNEGTAQGEPFQKNFENEDQQKDWENSQIGHPYLTIQQVKERQPVPVITNPVVLSVNGWMGLAALARFPTKNTNGQYSDEEQFMLLKFVHAFAFELDTVKRAASQIMLERILELAIDAGYKRYPDLEALSSMDKMLYNTNMDVFFTRFAYRIGFQLQGKTE